MHLSFSEGIFELSGLTEDCTEQTGMTGRDERERTDGTGRNGMGRRDGKTPLLSQQELAITYFLYIICCNPVL